MIWFLLQKIGFYIFVALTVYFVINRKFFNLLVLYFWGITFAFCYQFAFTIWFPTKIIALGMVLSILFLNGSRRKTPVNNVIRPFVVLLMIALLAGDILAFIAPQEYARHISKISRIINTNYTYLTTASLLFFGALLPRGFVKNLYPKYCLAVEVAIGFGLLHFLCLKAGIEFMPILRQDGSTNAVATFQSGGTTILRIYGVCGEPKNLAFFVLPYLLASLVMFSQKIYRYNNPKYHLAALCAGVFVLIYTFSSAALITFAIAVPVILWFLPLKNLTGKLLPLGIVAILAVSLWSEWQKIDTIPGQEQTESTGFMDLLYERSFGRAQEEMEDDRQERIVLDHIIWDPNPELRLLGYGTAQYTFHIPGQTIGNALIPMQSGLVLTLCDFGVLGAALYVILITIAVKTVTRSYKQRRPYGLAFGVAALSSVIGSMMFGSIVSPLIYVMPALYGLYDSSNKKMRQPGSR